MDGDRSDIGRGELAARIEELVLEVRRQGRAAVAAQAAAEACLERLERDEAREDSGGEAQAAQGIDWLTALLPVADAIDRMAAQASSMLAAEPPGVLARLLGPRVRDAAELAAMAEGLRVLRAQLGGALADLGVTIDRRVGVPLDATAHRVVEVRATRARETADTVVEVVRPGYSLAGRVVREADVVVGRNGGAR